MMSTNFHHLIRDPVEFVAAGGSATRKISPKQSQPYPGISGNDAKRIYEQIINEESSASLHEETREQKPHVATTKPKMSHMSTSRQYTNKDFFRASQVGDLNTVKSCICSSNLDVNAVDSYSWTPLMIASYEGHREVVLFLLSKGAQWIDQIDGSGYDARELACLGGHPEIVDLLMNSEQHIRNRRILKVRKNAEKHIKREKLWCEICKSHYYAPAVAESRDSHATSTLHLVSDINFPPKCHSHFYIPNSNKGFQLLQKGGWDGESGLGPDEDGAKYPVKTVLKRDKSGIGLHQSSSKAKVTHFESFDVNAVRGRVSRDSSKINTLKKSVRRTEEERQREIQFRRLFH